jgi:hypothetical protein
VRLLLVFFCLIFSSISIAQDFEDIIQTQNFCTLTNACAHLKFAIYPTTHVKNEFELEILPSIESSSITTVNAQLWKKKKQGQESSPVKIIISDEPNHYFATEAIFDLKGDWKVIITFKENGVDQKIVIPLEIKE